MGARKPVPTAGAPAADTNPAQQPADVAAPAPAAPATETPAASVTPAAPPASDTVPAIDVDALIDARVLVAFEGYEPNDIITARAGEISRLVKAGRVDDAADAVAAALEMQA